jgi:hypothetical protein
MKRRGAGNTRRRGSRDKKIVGNRKKGNMGEGGNGSGVGEEMRWS